MSGLMVMTLLVWLASALLFLSSWRSRRLLAKLQRALLALLGVGVGVLLGMLVVLFHASDAFSGKTLVAEVTTRPVSAEEFELTYRPVGRPPVTVRLRGNQWAISGGVIKWHPWLAALGLKSYHAPRRLSGQFSDLEAQRTHYPSVHALRPGVDPLWEVLSWADPCVPGIDAVYGSSAYVYVEPDRVQQVFVTPSGYMISRTKRSASPLH